MLKTGQTVDVTAVWINYKQLLPGTSFFALFFECFPQIFEEFVSLGTETSQKKSQIPAFAKQVCFGLSSGHIVSPPALFSFLGQV